MDFAINEISSNQGILYDANVVDSCIKVLKREEFVFNEDEVLAGRDLERDLL